MAFQHLKCKVSYLFHQMVNISPGFQMEDLHKHTEAMSYTFGEMSCNNTHQSKITCFLEKDLLFMNKGTLQACEAELQAVIRVWHMQELELQREFYKREGVSLMFRPDLGKSIHTNSQNIIFNATDCRISPNITRSPSFP